jgi:hypothetical protein
MSDYLASLVARNLGVADRLKPRVASTFEPAGQQPLGDTAAEPMDDGERIVEQVILAPGPAAPRRMPPAPQLSAPQDAPDPGGERRGEPAPAPGTARNSIQRRATLPDMPTRSASTPPPASADASPPADRDHESPAITDATAPGGEDKMNRPAPPERKAQPAPAHRRSTERRRSDAGHVHAADRVAHGGSAPPPSEAASTRVTRGLERHEQVPAARDVEVIVRSNAAASTPRLDAPTTRVADEPIQRAADRAKRIAATEAAHTTAPSMASTEPAFAAPRPGRPHVERPDSERSTPDESRSTFAVQVRLRQETPPRDVSADIASLEHSPSTVHVTIGRIEVKATPSSAAPKQKPAAAAPPGLDAYLRRRAEGSGR